MKYAILVLITLVSACTSSKPLVTKVPKQAPVEVSEAASKPKEVTATRPEPQRDAPLETLVAGGMRPRYDLTGTQITYTRGAEGNRQIYLTDIMTGEEIALTTEADNIDPVWTPDARIVFASNRDGDFDLWMIDPKTKDIAQITKLEGDELQPTVASIPFGFYVVIDDGCGDTRAETLDAYQKVLFTRRNNDTSEIWFSSIHLSSMPKGLKLKQTKALKTSIHGTHKGRVSPRGKRCSDPHFALDGLSAVWSCDGIIQDAPAEYMQSFPEAIAAVNATAPSQCSEAEVSSLDLDACLPHLKRKYARYPGKNVSDAALKLTHPAISANLTLLVAEADGRPMQYPRYKKQATWSLLPVETTERTHQLVWSPTGKEIAFETPEGIRRQSTDFYLQSVRNLNRFPELFVQRESALLKINGFVVRPANHKEFYILHDKLRYDKIPQFISADAALQVFRDEFISVLENAEREAGRSLKELMRALMRHYSKRFAKAKGKEEGELARYLAVLFATAWAPLEATKLQPDTQTDMEQWEEFEPSRPTPAAELLPEALPSIWPKLPESIRADVRRNVEMMLAHEGIIEMQVPDQPKPLAVDFSQFKIRGAYAENDLGGYFLAMKWLGWMKIPINASLSELIDTFKTTKVSKSTAYDTWRRVNNLVGSFMGRPVDATLEDVALELSSLVPFDKNQLEKRLLKRRGEIPIRDPGGEDHELAVTVFPRRLGLDVTFFRQLTYPEVMVETKKDLVTRGMPSSLDVFAALGNQKARTHAIEQAGEMANRYREVLDTLIKKTAAEGALRGYASTDLYHSWLATLLTLATPLELPIKSALRFAASEAWKDRQLYSALAGYTHLKHSAVLYTMQDIGVECGGETSYYVAIEQPILPAPRGFVEPNPAFFESLASLAQQTYRSLYGDAKGPNADRWAVRDEQNLNAMNFAMDLAGIAQAEIKGIPLTDEQCLFIEFIGEKLELFTIKGSQMGVDPVRQERGVALVTDIHTNSDRAQALAIGIGRIFDLWVVIPARVGESLTKGGILSFYEFTVPMSDRPTDAEWGKKVEYNKLPRRPAWTRSFIEER
ncbi:MAG: DUF3160 domain-containing protein [Deltaproteobacteria bacterium]|nr:DUF3160 domain-containing protein [Deltaproteobacteria bacterium]